METYLIFAFIAMLLFGVNAILYKVAPQVDAITLTLISFLVSALGTLIYWLFFVSKKQISLPGIGVGAIAGITSVIALISFIIALQHGPASTVNTIRALSAGVTVLLAVIFLAEKITLVKGIGIALAILAAILLAL